MIDDIIKHLKEQDLLKDVRIAEQAGHIRRLEFNLGVSDRTGQLMSQQVIDLHRQLEDVELKLHEMRIIGYAQALCTAEGKNWNDQCVVCQAAFILQANEALQIIDQN